MTRTHPVVAVCLFVIAGWHALGGVFFSCSAGSARNPRMRRLMVGLACLSGGFAAVLLAAGQDLL